MATPFERLAAVSRQTAEKVLGKAVRIYPVADDDPNAKPGLSQSEPSYETSALFFENTESENVSRSQPSAGGNRLIGRALQRTASIRLIPDQPFRTGFYLERLDDGAFFTIERFDPDGLGHVLAVVPSAKSPL